MQGAELDMGPGPTGKGRRGSPCLGHGVLAPVTWRRAGPVDQKSPELLHVGSLLEGLGGPQCPTGSQGGP